MTTEIETIIINVAMKAKIPKPIIDGVVQSKNCAIINSDISAIMEAIIKDKALFKFAP